MKVTVEIDCTPIEARKFFGLPNEVSAWVAGERGAHRSLYWAADPTSSAENRSGFSCGGTVGNALEHS